MSDGDEDEDFENKNESENLRNEKEIARNQMKILKKISVDLKNMRFVILEQFQNISHNFDKKIHPSEWEKLAGNLETFFLIFFLFANLILTIIFMEIGYSKQG